MATDTEQELFTILEAANYLRISRASMYRLVNQGDIKSFHIGKLPRIRRPDLEAYVERLMAEQHGI